MTEKAKDVKQDTTTKSNTKTTPKKEASKKQAVEKKVEPQPPSEIESEQADIKPVEVENHSLDRPARTKFTPAPAPVYPGQDILDV